MAAAAPEAMAVGNRRSLGIPRSGASSASIIVREESERVVQTRAQVERHETASLRLSDGADSLCLCRARIKHSPPARDATGAAEKLPGAHADAALFAFACPREQEQARMSAGAGPVLWTGGRLQWSHWLPPRQGIANQAQSGAKGL